MKMTPEGLALIREFEGFRGKAYRCPSGIWTSEDDARKVLAADVERFAAGVRASLKRPLTDPQFSALVSFAYNVGLGNFRSSSVLRAVNAGDFAAVPRRLQLWVKGGGKVLPGLVRRRAAEAAMFAGDGDVAEPPAADPGADPVAGKPLRKSTTVLAALVAALSAVLAGPAAATGSVGMLVPMILGLAAAGWIIAERWKKSREDGV